MVSQSHSAIVWTTISVRQLHIRVSDGEALVTCISNAPLAATVVAALRAANVGLVLVKDAIGSDIRQVQTSTNTRRRMRAPQTRCRLTHIDVGRTDITDRDKHPQLLFIPYQVVMPDLVSSRNGYVPPKVRHCRLAYFHHLPRPCCRHRSSRWQECSFES
jgi:hypothetical protein